MKTRQLAETWLADRLAATASAGATGVYRYPAPVHAVEPFVTVAVEGIPQAARALGQTAEKLERIAYRVEAWDRGQSAEAVAAISTAIYDAINGVGPVAVDGGSIIACTYVGALSTDVSVADGVTYQRGGGIFQLFVKTN